jgi:hypothetical protein
MAFTKNNAEDLFYEYLGQQDDFEQEWEMFQEFLETEDPLTQQATEDFLDILIENLSDTDPEPKKRLNDAIAKALKVANS